MDVLMAIDRHKPHLFWGLLVVLSLCARHGFADSTSAIILNPLLREQVIFQPIEQTSPVKKLITIEITSFTPKGKGPFPVLIFNHGTSEDTRYRQRYEVLARQFVMRGYAVIIPMRRGYGSSQGSASLKNQACRIQGYVDNAALAVNAAILYIKTRKDLNLNEALLGGHSAGGLLVLDFAKNTPHAPQDPKIVGILNFAGGIRDQKCPQWQKQLLTVMHNAGKSKIPSLWIYAHNDTAFDPLSGQKMFAAYKGDGGQGTLFITPDFVDGEFRNGHSMVNSPRGVKLWMPVVEKFLSAHGLPHKVVQPIPLFHVPSISYGDVKNLNNLPKSLLEDEAFLRAYTQYIAAKTPKFFAISQSDDWWSWLSGPYASADGVLESCNSNSNDNCHLLAVDNHIVFKFKK